MAFLGMFVQYVIILVFLVAVAACGIFVGKKLRDRKDAKMAALGDSAAKIQVEEK